MTTLAMTLPVARRSAIRIPRRDLVLDSASDLTLQVTLVASDTPAAQPLDISGLGPSLRLVLWYSSDLWDYGRGFSANCTVAWATLGSIVNATAGRVDVTIPRGVAMRWGRRLGWTIQFDTGDSRSALAWGAVNIVRSAGFAYDALEILDDNDVPITTDTDIPLEA